MDPDHNSLIFDAGDDDFETAVLERSKTTPVVVDFWAEWCGPGKALGPLLEAITREHAGSFALAKVDVDRNPQLAAAFGVRSIPRPTPTRRQDGKTAAA